MKNDTHTTAGPGALLTAAGAIAAASLIAPGLARAKHASFPAGSLSFEKDIPGTGDLKVLNYALALEYLEADLYAQAKMRLTTGGTNALGTVIPGLNIDPAQPDVDYITEFGVVEAEHRDLLRSVIGRHAIPQFKYNFGMESLSRSQVANLIFVAEATGVSAYLGAIPFLSTTAYLQVAGAIQGTEARHTAVISAVINELFGKNLNVAPPPEDNMGKDTPETPNRVLSRVSGFIVTS